MQAEAEGEQAMTSVILFERGRKERPSNTQGTKENNAATTGMRIASQRVTRMNKRPSEWRAGRGKLEAWSSKSLGIASKQRHHHAKERHYEDED